MKKVIAVAAVVLTAGVALIAFADEVPTLPLTAVSVDTAKGTEIAVTNSLPEVVNALTKHPESGFTPVSLNHPTK